MSKNIIQDDLIKKLIALLVKDGFSPEQLYKVPAVKGLLSTQQETIRECDAITIFEAAVNLTNDPTFILRLGQEMDIVSLGTFGFALMSCGNLHEALKLLLRYRTILDQGPSFESTKYSDGILLRINTKLGTAFQQRIVSEIMFSQVISIAKFLINQEIVGCELHLNCSVPTEAESYQQLLSIPIKFNQPHNQLIIPESVMLTRIRTANPVTNIIFQQQCEELLRGLNRVEDFSAAVRRLLIHAGGEFPNIKQVAEKLFVSERTLSRRLFMESTSFRTICDEVRNLLATQYLISTELTIAEIAALLDYGEPVSFRRAFARWNKTTPSAFRQTPH